MSIAENLKLKLENNQRTIFITDADDMLAAWRHRREKNSRSCRCFDFSRVPMEYRLSAPPNERAALMPCHGHGRTVHLSTQDLDALDTVSFAKRNVAQYISPIMDTATLSLVCKDLGITGRAIPKVIKGRQYIAFSGYAGLRTIFPGTIYSANNRRIISMAIGSLGIKNMVKTGGVLTICITVPLTILEAFLQDHATCYELAGNLASDLIQIGISSVIGGIAGLAAGVVTTTVFWPIATAIVFSVATGLGATALDNKYQLTEKLSALMEDMSEQLAKSIKNSAYEVERSVYHGLGEFIRRQSGYINPF